MHLQTVRETLKQCAAMKNVVQLCNQEGLLKRLQALQKELAICEKALADYLEGICVLLLHCWIIHSVTMMWLFMQLLLILFQASELHSRDSTLSPLQICWIFCPMVTVLARYKTELN